MWAVLGKALLIVVGAILIGAIVMNVGQGRKS